MRRLLLPLLLVLLSAAASSAGTRGKPNILWLVGENLSHVAKIDGSVALSEDLYARYTEHVAAQFSKAPLGTRIVTYYGRSEEIPNNYDCVDAPPEYELHFWEKTRTRLTQWGRI